MNECRFGKTASRYFDGELDARARAAFEAHLADCAACRERVRAYAQLDALMNDRPAAAPAPDLHAKLLAHATLAAPRPSLWQDAARMSRVLIPAAACLCLALGALLYVQIMQIHKAPAAPAAASSQMSNQETAVAQSSTPMLGYALSETEQKYLFGDNADALASVYPQADSQDQ